MTPAAAADLLASIALTGILGWCAVSDIRTRKIPNRAVLAVIGIYVLCAIVGTATPLLDGLTSGAIALVGCFVLYCLKVFGAGDAKLFAAVALFAGLAGLPTFAIATALAGGAMLVIALALQPKRLLKTLATCGQAGTDEKLPYGVAIAAGGLLIRWGPLLGYLPGKSA